MNGVISMSPCELNAMLALISNHFYTNLTEDQFLCLAVFLNELSKQMLAMPLYKDLCNKDGKFKPKKPPTAVKEGSSATP